MMIRCGPCALVALLIAANPLAGQFSVEGRLGGAIGNHAPAAAGLQAHPGLALSASAEYALLPAVSGYAGYTRASFRCRDGFCTSRTVSFTSHGISAGVVARPFSPLRLRAGLIRNRVAAGESGGEAGLGFETGMGVAIDLPGRSELRPEIVYRRHHGTTGGAEGATALLVASVGVAVRIGRGP